MRAPVPILALVLSSFARTTAGGEYPQWRGIHRTGVVDDSPPIGESFGVKGPDALWESEAFPRKAGHGSPAIAGGYAFLYVNWPIEHELIERRISSSALDKMHWFDQEKMPAELLASVEKARAELPPDLLGRELAEWSKAWVEKNLSKDDRRWRGTITRRFKDGPDALSLELLRKLGSIQDREFVNEKALVDWLDENGVEGKVRVRLLRAIPSSVTTAKDVLLCVSLTDGKTAWKYGVAARREEREGSSTPCVHEDRVYFLGTTHAHCVDRVTGKRVWATELPKGGAPSSFVIAGDQAVVIAKHLIAFERTTGAIAWEQPQVRGGKSSPTVWRHGDRIYLLVNGDRKTVSCVDAKTGDVAWVAKGGGFSSPVVSEDVAVVHTDDQRVGLVAYRLTPDGAEPIWSIPRKSRGAATPVIAGDIVYLLGGEEALCVTLADGTVHWRKQGRAEISSPVLVDGKIIGVTGNGRQLWMLRAGTKGFEELSKTRLSASRCASPAIADGQLILRLTDRLASFDIRDKDGT